MVKVDRVAIGGTTGLSLEQVLVIRIVMELMKASRQTEIGELDVSTAVQQNVVRLDVTATN